ncbi:WYL domain-containing protein [Halobacterium salinarum]|uniref:WYL domain-containing protein n=1 Tax=Halobacterium salinarum TaxID=2242 RepID=UPI0025536C79|nr:WYL domain-containing protein [Halobacterium salinarum]MDL0130228.1 WYL domain-containing protein [Halobacterium salinarum]MDL0133152.1 WYL domain-containing protein [Halobacterium salinarum]
MGKEEKVLEAMNERQVIALDYSGENEDRYHTREVEPWCYGVHKDTGNKVLRAYQVSGYSESGNSDEMPFWRLDRLDRMRSVNLTETAIRPNSPQGYNPQDKDMEEIIKSLPK